MGKRYGRGLIILTVILVLVCLLAGWYTLTVRAVNRYYSVCEEDVFTKTMKIRTLVPTKNGNILVLGTYKDAEGITSGESVFVKAYKPDGTLSEASGIAPDDGLSPQLFFESPDGARVLFSDNENKLHTAVIYDVNADGKLGGKTTAKTDAADGSSVKFFLCSGDGSAYWASLENSAFLRVYNANSEKINEFEVSSDVTVYGVSVIKGVTYVYGAKGNYKGYAEAFGNEGNSMYSLVTMEDRFSVVTDVYPAESEGNVMIFGKFFDDTEYVKLLGEGPKEIGKSLADVACESLGMQDGLYGEVLFTDGFSTSPWSSYFFIEATGEGTVKYVASPFSASPDFGISELQLTKYGSKAGFGVARMADNSEKDSYTVYIYPIDTEMKSGASAGTVLGDCIKSYFTLTRDGKLAAYYGFHTEEGSDIMKMKIYESTGDFAKDSKKNAINESVLEFFGKLTSSDMIFGLFVFATVISTAFLAADRKDNIC